LLRDWRTAANLTQRDLAERLKKQPSFVHKCEVGDRRVDPVELILWCRACKVSPAKAMGEIEKQV
jgi:predicted transcriptional regulator